MKDGRHDIRVSNQPLSLDDAQHFVSSESAGAINTFIGTTRNKTEGRIVKELRFEAYEAMAVSELEKIAQRAMADFEIEKVAIYHRTGTLAIGDIPVIIAVSAAHRDAAFKACRYCIDTLKKTVPIWKKEVFEDGEVWVAAHP